MRRSVAAALALGTILCASSPSQAQENTAKEHYLQGVALFEAGNYKAALAEFLESYEARPNWKLRHTIAVCYFNLNRFVDAKKELDLYIAEGGEEVPADKKTEVDEMLVQIANLTAQVKIEVNVDGATIWIDDEKVAASPMKESLILDSGVYQLEITAPGYVKYSRDLKLAGGDKKVYDITLESKGGEVTPPPKGGETGPGPVEKKPKEKKPKEKKPKEKKAKAPTGKEEKMAKGLMIGALASAGATLGFGVGVIISGVQVNKNKNDFDSCIGRYPSNPGLLAECQDFYKSEGEKARFRANMLLIPLAVCGAAAIGLGVGSAVMKKKAKSAGEKPAEAAPTVMLTPLVTGDTVYLGVSGTF